MDWTGQAVASRVKPGAGGSDLLAPGWARPEVWVGRDCPSVWSDSAAEPRSPSPSELWSLWLFAGCPLRKPLLLTLLCLPHPGTASTGKPSQLSSSSPPKSEGLGVGTRARAGQHPGWGLRGASCVPAAHGDHGARPGRRAAAGGSGQGQPPGYREKPQEGRQVQGGEPSQGPGENSC